MRHEFAAVAVRLLSIGVATSAMRISLVSPPCFSNLLSSASSPTLR
jgi:hypothetical protein